MFRSKYSVFWFNLSVHRTFKKQGCQTSVRLTTYTLKERLESKHIPSVYYQTYVIFNENFKK